MGFFKLSLAATAALALLSNASTIVNFYSDQDCQNLVGIRAIEDNSCAANTGGYQSFMISSAGTVDQNVEAWGGEGCTGPGNGCQWQVGICVNTNVGNSEGNSNSMSSSHDCTYAGRPPRG